MGFPDAAFDPSTTTTLNVSPDHHLLDIFLVLPEKKKLCQITGIRQQQGHGSSTVSAATNNLNPPTLTVRVEISPVTFMGEQWGFTILTQIWWCLCWYEIFLSTGWKFHFRLFIVQWTTDDTFHINPSWLLMHFHPDLKLLEAPFPLPSMCLWARRNKTNTQKKPHWKTGRWDKCQCFEIMLLLQRQRQETRCRDAIWREFVSSSSHMRAFPNKSPWIQFLFVWRAVDSARCVSASCAWGRNPASRQNTNNNPSMFLIRLLFLLTSAVSWPETIAVTFSVFFCYCLCMFVCFQICSIPRRPGKPTRTHYSRLVWFASESLPHWLCCGCRSDQPGVVWTRLWAVAVSIPAAWRLLVHGHQQLFNLNLRSWGSSFERQTIFRSFFFCSFWIVSWHLTGVQNLSSKRWKKKELS